MIASRGGGSAPIRSWSQPGKPQDLNRFAYINNNPLAAPDPSGHGPPGAYPLPGAQRYGAVLVDMSAVPLPIRYGIQAFSRIPVVSLLTPGVVVDAERGVIRTWTVDEAMAVIVAGMAGGDLVLAYAEPQLCAVSGEVHTTLSVQRGQPKTAVTASSTRPTAPYEVGVARDLLRRSTVGDDLAIHHVPQGQAAQQVIPGWTREGGPAIALPRHLHEQLPTLKGAYLGTARELLARDLWHLRKYTDVPNTALRMLLELNRQLYSGVYK